MIRSLRPGREKSVKRAIFFFFFFLLQMNTAENRTRNRNDAYKADRIFHSNRCSTTGAGHMGRVHATSSVSFSRAKQIRIHTDNVSRADLTCSGFIDFGKVSDVYVYVRGRCRVKIMSCIRICAARQRAREFAFRERILVLLRRAPTGFFFFFSPVPRDDKTADAKF